MIAIHQSQFLPWLPYFYKILKSDIFVVLDDVQFEKNGVQNRNMIKTPRGALWLTVPVRYKFGATINEVQIADTNEYTKLLKTLEMNYGRSGYFQQVYTPIRKIFSQGLTILQELNAALLDTILNTIGVRPEIRYSSSFNTTKKKDDLIIEIINHFGEDKYLSGPGALDYMDLNKFKKAGIKVYVSNFSYTEYKQLWNKQVGFLPDLSIADLIFNELKIAKRYIMNNGDIREIM